ncbi:leucyl aminopeptidase family protein [bacterium]|nr:leucyl aminopeptidase family protein [bacterium]
MEIKLKELKEIKLKKQVPLVFPFFEGEKIDLKKLKLSKEAEKILKDLKEGENEIILTEKGERIIFACLGKKEKFNEKKFRIWIRKTFGEIKSKRVENFEILLENLPLEKSFLIKEAACNLLLANYRFFEGKKEEKEVKEVSLLVKNSKNYLKNLEEGRIIGEAVNFARDLANLPPSELYPQKLAEKVKKEFKGNSFEIEIFDEKKLEKLGFEGILRVGQGSSHPPRLILIKYFGKKERKNFDLGLAGKGVIFDSGGLNIKPWEGMLEMHLDKSGAAAVLGALRAIFKLKLPLNIVAAIPAVENLPSGKSYHPRDILKLYNGKTVEVIHTDAEGRLILADALSFLSKDFKPKFILDVATLCGGTLVALGQQIMAVFTNQEKLEEKLKKLGEKSGDYLWTFPLWEEYQEEIKSDFAELRNIGKGRYGDPINATIFLKNFVGDLPWIHIDIAPTMSTVESQGLSKGASGSGTRFLIAFAQEFLREFKNG